MKTVCIGAGAGFAGDRTDPAIDLAREWHLGYLVFECLAGRIIAVALDARGKTLGPLLLTVDLTGV